MRKKSMLVVEDEDIMREALFDYFQTRVIRLIPPMMVTRHWKNLI